MDEKLFWIGFSACPGIGPKKFALLLRYFGTAEAAWKADRNALIQSGIGEATSHNVISFRSLFDLEQYRQQLQINKIHVVTLNDTHYPELLRLIETPPFVLYIKGDLSQIITQPAIAIVGTRRITAYGKSVTTTLTENLVGAGYTIISGLAMGVDTIAHSVTIEHNGRTAAVLGCGVDCCYPVTNRRLYEDIISSGGAILSEFPLGMPPSPGSFPSRNRIIAGLATAIIVTEGAEDSGALYTASAAFASGRTVYAIPGPITSALSKGPNALIAKGAKLITGIDDLLANLGVSGNAVKRKQINADTPQEQRVLDELANENLQFDELVRRTSFDATQLSVLLSMMEMKQMIKSSEGGIFSLDM